jgi:4-amino-4-deoxychorismate lyase
LTAAPGQWQVVERPAGTWVSERACQYGDGLFETIATVNGRPCLWRQHIDRLEMGCSRLSLPKPDVAALEAIMDSLCREHASRGVKLFWTAGRSERGYRRSAEAPPTGVVQPFSWAPDSGLATLRLTQCGHRLSENPRLAGIKHLNRLDQVLARAEWDDPSIDEGLMLGQDGRIVCGTRSNIVLEKDNQLTTPDLGSAGVAGVVRQCLIEEGRRSANPILLARVTPEQLFAADAVYLTNALTGVARVARIDDVQFDTGRAIHPLLAGVHQRALRATPA